MIKKTEDVKEGTDAVIFVRCTDELRKRVERIADKEGLSITRWCIEVIIRELVKSGAYDRI